MNRFCFIKRHGDKVTGGIQASASSSVKICVSCHDTFLKKADCGEWECHANKVWFKNCTFSSRTWYLRSSLFLILPPGHVLYFGLAHLNHQVMCLPHTNTSLLYPAAHRIIKTHRRYYTLCTFCSVLDAFVSVSECWKLYSMAPAQ
jgi:hypothetical protein